MTKAELESKLSALGVRPDAYNLDGHLEHDHVVLDHDYRGYLVFYYERGLRADERIFETEDEACRHLLSG